MSKFKRRCKRPQNASLGRDVRSRSFDPKLPDLLLGLALACRRCGNGLCWEHCPARPQAQCRGCTPSRSPLDGSARAASKSRTSLQQGLVGCCLPTKPLTLRQVRSPSVSEGWQDSPTCTYFNGKLKIVDSGRPRYLWLSMLHPGMLWSLQCPAARCKACSCSMQKRSGKGPKP